MKTTAIAFPGKRQNQAQRTVEAPDAPLIWLPSRHLGPMIRRARHRQGWPLEALTERAAVYQCPSTVAKAERGKKDIDYLTVCQLATVLQEPALIAYANWLVHQILQDAPCANGPEAA
ncbi:helix-turn-helix domain-containing protein [Sulfobacillus harzensis]|uniref:Helix-turn-helix transcriptional regulator n=1 Tax=Sulfobacillus harzensis TaxID=2729629 RepID=A0A7Y0L2H3_9FIRM|nr:helix-turn-helix transcriptional regulator [Sulfobacillus harzensis]NMP21868.1 helix-turn-helix transcriptional regulator [Sulfobacillus harzensis]